jgi:hypothetical protein
MGLLDPKLDKKRTFALLRKKGAYKAELEFSGGHDEGGVEQITLFIKTEGEDVLQDHIVWYCGGYGYDNKTGKWQPMSKPQNDDEELSDLLQGPIDETFGSWASVESTSGVLTWDVEAGTVKLNYSQDEPRDHEEEW